jgi:hypothetical protein
VRAAACARVLACTFALALAASTTDATVPIVEGEEVSFTLAGYLRSLAGVQQPGIDTAGLLPDDLGVSSGVLRLEWRLDIGEAVTFEVAERFFWRVTSEDLGLGTAGLGLGVSRAPGRTVDLSSDLVAEEGLLLVHDIDRLALRLYLDAADIVIGRQAITWGRALLFPATDLFATFSPFDLDASEKPGSDAIRVITSPWDHVELDFVVADRGEVEDLSGAVRANLFLENADVFVGAGKFWDEVALLGGMSAEVGSFSLLFEGTVPYDTDAGELLLPRLTAGGSWFSGDWTLGLEYHFNGAGVGDSAEYIGHASSDTISRGETYLFGRHYLGALAAWQADDLVRFGLSVITNLQDPSAVIAPTATYDVAESVEIGLGAYVGVGEESTLLPPTIGSELGTAGNLFYVLMAAYY